MAEPAARAFPESMKSSPSLSRGGGPPAPKGPGVEGCYPRTRRLPPGPLHHPAGGPPPRASSGRSGNLSAAIALVLSLLASPLAARDSLGVFGAWGAFRDPRVPRCYAIAAARNDARDHAAFASVGTWPQREVRGQVHVRLSRNTRPDATVSLNVGG